MQRIIASGIVILLGASVSLFAADEPAEELEAGKSAVVTAPVDVRNGDDVIGKFDEWTCAKITRIDEDRVLLTGGDLSGWVPKDLVVTLDEAESQLAQAAVKLLKKLDADPPPADEWKKLHVVQQGARNVWFQRLLDRGALRVLRGGAVPAVAAAAEPSRIERAYELRKEKLFDEALRELDAELRENPDNHAVFYSRGKVWEHQGEGLKAIAAYSDYIAREPADPDGYNARAWVLATIPDPRVRDGDKAVADALKCCRLSEWNDVMALDTLAASYAQAGDFDQAAAWQDAALSAAPEESAAAYKARLELYHAKKPYRLDVPSPSF